MILKLALVGRDIAHSKSQSIYEKILKQKVDYTLLDYSDPKLILSAKDILSTFTGFSITAPYKTHFLDEVQNLNPKVPFINAIGTRGSELVGINTDYMAVLDILSTYIKNGVKNVILLGDGAMATITLRCCEELGMTLTQLSRKLNNMAELDKYIIDKSTLVINSCSRAFVLKTTKSNFKFWDYNYDMPEHRTISIKQNLLYQDGMPLLELQAKYALDFWRIKIN